MTPMAEAKKAFAAGSDLTSTPKMAVALEAAILAYLQAVAKDETEVEAVARSICAEVSGDPDAMDAWEYDPAGPVNRQLKKAPLWTKQTDTARAALTLLASRVKG